MNWRRLSQLLALLAAGLGALGFAGWAFGIDILTRLHPGWVTMKANTALCLMLAGTAVALRPERPGPAWRPRVALVCGFLVLLVGGLTLAEILGGWDFGIDQALFRESLESAGRSFPGRMGPASAAIFILLGAAIVLLDAPPILEVTPAQICASIATALTFTIFLGYFYDVELPAVLTPYTSIALHTVMAFLCLCAAVILSRPERGFVGLFLADNIGGVVARRILPFAILAPVLLGWIFVSARQAGYYGRGTAVALLAASVTLMFTALVWWLARALVRLETGRQGAEENLRASERESAEQYKQLAADLRQARDSAEAANRAKDDFLAALSHELRTPLTPVLMLAAEMEKSPDLPPEVRSDFAMIRRNVGLEARIIDDLLDLTRITHGKLALRFESVAVHALIAHAVSILEAERAEKNIALGLELNAPRSRVQGDAVRLQQVVWNVLKNAIKFTPPGGQVLIRSWNEDSLLRISTTDTGLGITAEEMPRIFKAFTQGGEAESRFGGLGLGLSISALLVQEHHGRLWAESEGRDNGATFHLELPLLPVAPAADLPPLVLPPVATRGGALRILLVEDHEDTRDILQRLVRRWGHSASEASCVAAAHELLAGGPENFDLLLSDLGLPDGTGLEVLARWKELTTAPAVVMSGYGMEADLAATRAAGFVAHLVKPVSADALRELLERFSAAPEAARAEGAEALSAPAV